MRPSILIAETKKPRVTGSAGRGRFPPPVRRCGGGCESGGHGSRRASDAAIPRLVLVQASGVGRREAALVALVSDGARRYTVPVELERAAAGWRVTRVGS